MRGRPPKPKALKTVTNSRWQNNHALEVEGDLFVAPDWMTTEQKAQWTYTISSAPYGLLKYLDREILSVWVVACCLHREASMKIAQQGLLVKSPVKGEDMQSPYLAIINKQAMIMARLAAELGFTPSARSRIAIAGSGSTIDHNPLDEFLN